MFLKKVAAVFLVACVPWAASAAPLGIAMQLHGTVAGTSTPLVQTFGTEVSTDFATLAPGSATTQISYFWDTALTVGTFTRGFSPNNQTGQFVLQDDVLNASGQVVDTFDLALPAYGPWSPDYHVAAHLEFAPETFSDPDGAAILTLAGAPVLHGDYVMHASWIDWSGGISRDHVDGTLTSIDLAFSGPGAVPSVPEPGHFALILAGLAAVALRKRW